MLDLARCDCIERRENVIAFGNCVTVTLGLGMAACQRGLSVGFITAATLVHELFKARDEERLLRLLSQLAGYKLLIIDKLGYAPLLPSGVELMFVDIRPRYRKQPVGP